jgi:hypothetical protein
VARLQVIVWQIMKFIATLAWVCDQGWDKTKMEMGQPMQ